MTIHDAARPWVPAELEQAIQQRAAACRALSSDALEQEVIGLLARHEQYMDRECLSLYAGTNVLNPRAARLLASSVGSRPSLGYPGAKYEMGMQHAEQIEIIAAELLKELFGCRYAEFRVGSGSLANLYADMPRVADLIARVLVRGESPAAVRDEVVALRQGFQTLHFVRA